MNDSARAQFLDLDDESQARLIAAARDKKPVRGLTHNFYKYPARFSPTFAAAAIEAFTEPGDLVLDPHVGGGTTLVEALAAGRRAIGVDISTLSEFVSTVKSTIFSAEELHSLSAWAKVAATEVNLRRPAVPIEHYKAKGYYKHLDHPDRWRFRKAIEQALRSASELGSDRLELFGRCVVLRTAQWALDGRSKDTSIDAFRKKLVDHAAEMVVGARALAERSIPADAAMVICRSAAGIEFDERLTGKPAPKLIVTSPPYPGIHVLYHRWQVDGRKEAPLPFMITNKLDGSGGSYYTMGDRKQPELATYFASIRATMSSAAALADTETTFVQMIAFSDPSWQLPRYLDVMRDAGLTEVFLPALQGEGDGRLWRSVPGRRWYSEQRGETPGSKEVVLLHRKAYAASAWPAKSLVSTSSSARSPRL